MNPSENAIRGKSLVVFDLDGTLAPSKQPMKPSMASLIRELLARVKVAVISGGGFPQFQKQFLASFPPGADGMANLFILPTSGTRLYAWNGTWTERYAEDLSDDEKKLVLSTFDYALAASGYVKPEKTYGDVVEDRGSQITFSALGQQAPLDIKSRWDPDHSKREKIAELMRPKLPGFDVRIGGTNSIDVTRRGVNKAYGIRKLESLLSVPTDRILFVGDALFYGGNDFPAKSTGVDCIQVSGPEETEALVRSWFS